MSPQDKKKVADWLREQCRRLELLPHAVMIRENIARLKKTADELECEAMTE